MPPNENLAVLADTFRLLGDPSRLAILFACRDEACSVGAIAQATRLAPSLVSHHLRLLRAARMVRPERRGRHVYYALADAHAARVIADMADHVGEEETAHVHVLPSSGSAA